MPGVEFILDIGGQDMKCLRVKDGVIEHIMLNEACSIGLRFASSRAFADVHGHGPCRSSPLPRITAANSR